MSQNDVTEKILIKKNALPLLFGVITAEILLIIATILVIMNGIYVVGIILAVASFVAMPILFGGFKSLAPNEALVLTLFGKYYGTLAEAGFFFVNPFCTAVNPEKANALDVLTLNENVGAKNKNAPITKFSNKISLKAITLNNEKQKVNDEDGNPIEIGVVVVWRIKDTAKAVFSVDNYRTFISSQTDSAIRQVARLYPYDVSQSGDEKSLRGSAVEVADELKNEVQKRVMLAGIEVLETRIAHLAYAPEIAAAMLQRQQAAAIIAARQKIVDGAVGMVQSALEKLEENGVCELDAERKAQMVSNLLVILCGNKEAQPIVNAGTIY